jgi:flagellar export protein FliJ
VAHFRFRFDALQRYREYRRDLVRLLFAQVLQEREQLLSERRAKHAQHLRQFEEIRSATAKGNVDVDAAAARRYHAGQITMEVVQLERQIVLVEEQLEACRSALVAAEKDVDVLERLAEKQRRTFEYEQGRREQLALEDAWQAARFAEYAG